ncbi:hypothetical protein BOTCAL_0326g00050 [Botryotinia calthae]|uniref:Uncharacterized protein n=1 Tax=Botryotinia calthae TaxID=38488 RepID=A0A4Y8CU14_9HELO|nr:hypothetical protein BOTCAL_0326g00050 [Botryotinia calthae]
MKNKASYVHEDMLNKMYDGKQIKTSQLLKNLSTVLQSSLKFHEDMRNQIHNGKAINTSEVLAQRNSIEQFLSNATLRDDEEQSILCPPGQLSKFADTANKLSAQIAKTLRNKAFTTGDMVTVMEHVPSRGAQNLEWDELSSILQVLTIHEASNNICHNVIKNSSTVLRSSLQFHEDMLNQIYDGKNQYETKHPKDLPSSAEIMRKIPLEIVHTEHRNIITATANAVSKVANVIASKSLYPVRTEETRTIDFTTPSWGATPEVGSYPTQYRSRVDDTTLRDTFYPIMKSLNAKYYVAEAAGSSIFHSNPNPKPEVGGKPKSILLPRQMAHQSGSGGESGSGMSRYGGSGSNNSENGSDEIRKRLRFS